MRKNVFITSFLAVLLTLTLSHKNDVKASVSNIPYQTYSYGLKGELVNTATAYEGTFILNDGFSNPEDIFIDSEDNVYIADTGNGRIYKYNPHTKESVDIGYGTLINPSGVYVDRNFDIYVADSLLNQVFWFDKEGTLKHTYDKPTEALFGEDTEYRPTKVLVDARKNVYVITQGEGASNGIIQMDMNGEFLGYFGVNQVTLNFQLYLRRMLMSKEERETFVDLMPKPTTNFAIDHKGLIYTVIENELETPIKKLNIQGNNVLVGNSLKDPFYKDIFVGQDGLIYTVSSNTTGQETDRTMPAISVHDNQGNLIFAFGDIVTSSLKIGEFGSPLGIAADSNGDIWVLDSTGKNVQVFTKTEFANMVLSAINYYNNSEYDKAEELFKEVVRQNAMFSLAHSNLGKLYQRNNEFDLALESYKIANNKFGYSEVYWELRDKWIADNLLYLILIPVLTYVGYILLKRHKERIKGYQELKNTFEKIKGKTFYKELTLLKRMLKDPSDVVYEIKFRQSIRIRTAIVLYVVFIFLNIISDFLIKGYLFSGFNDNVVLSFEILKWFIPLITFGIANHLMNSLQSGEGFYRDIFIGVIYSMAPIFIFKLPLDLLSNVLTYNEAFIYQLAYLVIYAWTVINIIVVIKEINNYKPIQLVINLVLTLFSMLMMIVLYLVINVLTTQLISFIQGILQEVFLSV